MQSKLCKFFKQSYPKGVTHTAVTIIVAWITCKDVLTIDAKKQTKKKQMVGIDKFITDL